MVEKILHLWLLQLLQDSLLELDCILRALGPCNPNLAFIRDVTCRIHCYKVKAEIMQAAHTQDTILFKEINVMLLSDLSKQTLEEGL